jgi:hypothetical protein
MDQTHLLSCPLGDSIVMISEESLLFAIAILN